MLSPRFFWWIFQAGMMSFIANTACSQDYPNKPIRIVTSAPGGGADLVSRLIAHGLSDSLGWQVIVDNRGGMLTAEIGYQAPPDGYTLVLSSNLWITPLLRKVSYDPVKDFSPITLAVSTPAILVVHPSLPVSSVRELIALAKARPGALNYGSGPPGASAYFAAEMFKAMAGVNIVSIPFKGGGPAVLALLTGEVQVMFATPSSVASYIDAGKLRALAVTSARPSALLPGIPTVAASGLHGYDAVNTTGIFAPAGTPATIINRLNQEIVRILKRTDVKEKLAGVGVEVVGSSPKEFAAVVKAEMAALGKVFKDAGIRAQ